MFKVTVDTKLQYGNSKLLDTHNKTQEANTTICYVNTTENKLAEISQEAILCEINGL